MIEPDEWIHFDSNTWFIGFGSFSIVISITCDEGSFSSDMTNGFIIEKAWYTPGSYEEPPDGGIEIAKKCVNFGEVLNWIMEDIFENRAQDFAMYYDYLETNHLYPKK